jgi:hypothetical protein
MDHLTLLRPGPIAMFISATVRSTPDERHLLHFLYFPDK